MLWLQRYPCIIDCLTNNNRIYYFLLKWFLFKYFRMLDLQLVSIVNLNFYVLFRYYLGRPFLVFSFSRSSGLLQYFDCLLLNWFILNHRLIIINHQMSFILITKIIILKNWKVHSRIFNFSSVSWVFLNKSISLVNIPLIYWYDSLEIAIAYNSWLNLDQLFIYLLNWLLWCTRLWNPLGFHRWLIITLCTAINISILNYSILFKFKFATFHFISINTRHLTSIYLTKLIIA